MTNCDYCDDDLFDDYDAIYQMRSGDVVRLCDPCKEKFDEHDGVDGKFIADRCGACGHLKGIRFMKYKPRGRPKGSKTDPRKLSERLGIRPLDSLAPLSDGIGAAAQDGVVSDSTKESKHSKEVQ